MRDLKLVKVGEPFTKLLTQGMVLNEAFARHDDGKHYYWADDLDIVRDEHAHVVSATLKATASRCITRAGRRCPSPRTTVSTRRS